MAENLIDESVQVTEQPKPQKPASYISGLRDNLVHFYGENNVPDEASFTKKITSDAEYLKGIHANLIHAYGEENVPDINAFSDKVKKKDQTGLPTAQISGEVSAPIGLALPSQKDNRPDFQKGLNIAQKGYAMPSAGGTEKQPEQGSLSNIGQNLREKTVEKAADIAIPTIKFLRNLSGKLPGANKPEDIYNEQGELTDYGKSIEGSDFLGQAIKSFSETRQKERELQQTVGKLPETSAGEIAQGVTSIAPDMALALMTGGRNIFGGTSKLAAAGNALTGAFFREQAITGAAKGYDISDGKDVGETLGNIAKEGAKDAGTALLYEGAGFLGGKIGNVLSSPLKNTTAKGAVNLLARLATFSLGTSNAQSLIDKGELASEDEVFKNLGIAGVLEAFHGTLHGAGVAAGKVAEKVAQDKYIAGLKKVNDIRAGSAIQNFMKASPDVIDNLVKSEQTAQHLNLAAMDAVKRAEGMEDGAEKSQLLKTASNLTQAADIKHVTDVIANSTDGLAHIANDIPEDVRDAFMQKAQDIHQSLNPTELQKQGHAANISQAEEIAKQVEPLAKPENPNVLERIQAERKLNEAKGVIDENTKNLNKVLDEQEKRNKLLQQAKLKEEVKLTEVPMEVKPIEGIAYHGDTGKSESSGYTYLGDKNLAKSYAEENGGKVKEIKYKLEKPFVVDSDAKSKIISDLAEDFQKNNPKSKWHPDTTNFINEKLKELGYDGLVIKKEALDTEYGYEKIGGTYGDPQIILFPKAAEVKPTEEKVTKEIKPADIRKDLLNQINENERKLVEKQQLDIDSAKNDLKEIQNDNQEIIDKYVKKSGYKIIDKNTINPINGLKFPESEIGKYYKFNGSKLIRDSGKNLALRGADIKSKSRAEGAKAGMNKYADALNSVKDYENGKITKDELLNIIQKSGLEIEQLKTKENAIQEPSAGEVLQRPQEGIGETRGERPRVEPSIKGAEATKEGEQAKVNEKAEELTPYQKALKEKQEAEKKQTRQFAGEKAGATRKIIDESNKIEANDARSAALKYLTGAKLSWDAIDEIVGNVKRATLNTGARELKSREARARDYVAKKGEGQSLDEAAHSIWDNLSEEMQGKMDTQDIKDALMNAVSEHTSKAEAAKALIEGYKEESIEELEIKHYEKYGDNAEKEADSQFNDAPKEDLDIDKELINANYETEQQFQDAYWDAHQATYNAPKETPSIEAEKPAVTEEEKIKSEEAIITHAANAETREKLGLNQPELLSNLTDKERYDKAQEMIKKGYDMNKLIDKMYNPEEVLNPLENAISNLYKQSLLSEIEKNPSNENLALAKRFLDARDQANSRAGAALQSLKGEAPKTILDFYVNKMEDNNTDILTDKQKEEAKKEYEGIKAKLDIVEAKNKELEKLNSELLAQKAIDEQKDIKKTTTKEKRDYTAERKEVINSIKEKLKKARTGQGGLTAVPIPYAKELAEIAPDVAKLVRLYVEEGAEKLDDVVGKIYDVLKDEIKGLQKKDVQDVIAGKYGKPNKAKTEVENKIKDLKIEAKLINAIDDARQLKPKTEREKVEQNRKLTDLRKELNKVRKETGYYDESKLKSIIEKNKKETENLKEKLEKGDFEEKEKPVPFIESPELKKKYPELYNQYLDAVDAKDEQQHEYELKRAIEQMNALSKTEKYKAQAGKFVKEGFSTIKALKAGIDNSAVFVQNGIAVLNPMNYKATGKALVAQTQDLFSESRFRRRIVEVHENKPLWNLISESGLDYLDPKGYNKAMRDEQFGSTNWLERKVKIGNKEIQIAKYTTAPFERLFTSFSNEFRLQIFLRGAEQLAKEGMTIESNPKEYQDLASYVNNITGRGKVHETLKPAEGLISNVIWAPKLLSSSLNMVGLGDLANLGKNKGYYRDMTPKMRKYAIGQTAAGIGTGIALMAAYSLLPNKQVDWDPESVTFGQMKDTETGWGYNVFGRLTPIVRYLAMMTMLSKKVGQGKAQVVDPLKETYKFVRGKMQPTAGIFSDVIMRKDFSGKPYKLSNVPSDLFEPLFINDLRQQLAIDGTTSLLTKGIPAFYGLKVSNDKIYDKRDLKSLENTIDSSTIDKNTLFNYNENRPINNHEYKEFITKRDDLLKDYYKNIHENGVPIINKNGKAEILPIDSKELTKDIFIKELNRLKGLATKNAKKDLFGSNELTDEQLDVKDELSELRDKQGIGSTNQ